jgi:4-carboxymuconolactone decarboxylase
MKLTRVYVLLPIIGVLAGCAPLNFDISIGSDEEPVIVAESDIPADIHRDSWARLPTVQRENLDAAGREAFDTFVSPGTGYETGLRGPIGMWMNSPELAKAMFPLRLRVRYGTEKDQRLTELIIISTAREINNQYEYSAHEPLARQAGLEEEILEIVKYRRAIDVTGVPGLGRTEKLLIQFARELVSEPKVSAETFASAIDIFGNEGVTDIVGLIGYYSFVAMTLKAFDVQRQPGSELYLPMIDN